ncbi:ribbon-helix-helix protein, CopG family [Persephonella sp. IF05-L8]|uniref:ribbon-helix-helix protein, CopG family n=1 Tax=Persephonella sp. IF05-L8 TaxID=1158338 RepID=UPI00049789DE
MKKEKKLQVWVTKDLEEKLKKTAQEEGRSISDIVREALNLYFKEKERKSMPDFIMTLPGGDTLILEIKKNLMSDKNFMQELAEKLGSSIKKRTKVI